MGEFSVSVQRSKFHGRKKCPRNRGHTMDTIWTQTNKKGPALSRKSLIFMARPRGFEPLTSASGGQRSIQLSYGRIRNRELLVNFECAILRAQGASVQPHSSSRRLRFSAFSVRG